MDDASGSSGRSGLIDSCLTRPAPTLCCTLQFAGGASLPGGLHCRGGAAERVRSLIPGALSILKGAVPGRARGLGHMAPTYFRREPGIVAPTA